MADLEAGASADLADREDEYEAFVRANLRRNYLANYFHGMLGMTGFRLLNAPTIVPAYLHMLTGSAAIVGLGQALPQLGAIVSPIVGASQIEHRTRMLPVAIRIGTMMRVQILGLALAGWLLAGVPLLAATLFFLFMFGLLNGSQRVTFQALMAKVIPIERRGRLQAWRNLTGGAIAAALAYAAGRWFIGEDVLGNGYATTFLLAFVLTSLGLVVLQLLIREPEPPTVRPRTTLRERMRDFPALLADLDYRWFMVAQGLSVAARVSAPFYVLYAGETLTLDGPMIGLLSFAFLGADTVSNLLWGNLGDRHGFRLVFMLTVLLWLAAVGGMLLADSRIEFVAAFAGLGAATSGYMMAVTTMVLEFGKRDDVPMRLALSTPVEGALAALAPIAGGVVASFAGYTPLFVASAAFLAAALLVLLFKVRETRRL